MVHRLHRVPLHRPPPQVRPARRQGVRRARRPRLRQRRRPVARRGLHRRLRVGRVQMLEAVAERGEGRSDRDLRRRPSGDSDNIRLAPDGSFWIALHQMTSPLFDLITRWTLTKRIAASFPALLERIKPTMKGAKVAQVSENGEIIRVLDDSEGKVINFVTSVTEFNGDLFFGSLSTNFVGIWSLAQLPQGLQNAVPS